MIQTIIVGVDGSPGSTAKAEWCRNSFGGSGATLIAVGC
jgi:hypothetical protein